MVDVDAIDRNYTRWSNYYLAIIQLPDRERRAWFNLAIDEYLYEDVIPKWEPTSLEAFLWRMLVPSMDSTKKGWKSKGHGTGPRDSMKGNQNASKAKAEENTASKTQADHKQDASSPQADSKRKRVNFKSGLTDAGVTEDIASDFMDVRKGKKARNTQTALDAILSEIQTAKDNGTSADEFIKAAVVNSWQMPKYEWYKNRQDSTLTTQSDRRHADRRRTETRATSWQDYSETF